MTRVSLLVLAFVLAACGGGGDDATTTSTVVGAAAEGDATTVPAPAETTTTAAPDTTTSTTTTLPPTTTTTVQVDNATCLVGDWVVSQDEMQGFYDTVIAESDAAFDLRVSGRVFLSFTEDAYQWRPDFVLELLVSGIAATGDVAGTIDGTYATADGVVTSTSEVNTLTLTVTVLGNVIDADDDLNSILNSSPVNGAAYECGGDAPLIHFNTSVGTTPVQLAPA